VTLELRALLAQHRRGLTQVLLGKGCTATIKPWPARCAINAAGRVQGPIFARLEALAGPAQQRIADRSAQHDLALRLVDPGRMVRIQVWHRASFKC
jgi:hypothetical protein